MAQIKDREIRNSYYLENLDHIIPITSEEEELIGKSIPQLQIRHPDHAHSNYAYTFDSASRTQYEEGEAKNNEDQKARVAATWALNFALEEAGKADHFDMRHHKFPHDYQYHSEDKPGFHRWEPTPGLGSHFLRADLPEVGQRLEELASAVRRQAYIRLLEY